jgi:hypothetical protein
VRPCVAAVAAAAPVPSCACGAVEVNAPRAVINGRTSDRDKDETHVLSFVIRHDITLYRIVYRPCAARRRYLDDNNAFEHDVSIISHCRFGRI